MKNVHSTDGIAEDIIRSFVQIASAEIHAKTLLEKRVSELENGLINVDDPDVILDQMDRIAETKKEVADFAQVRRDDMLLLYQLFGAKGDKEKWCTVKHLGIAMMTAFEAWQASDMDSDVGETLLNMALKKNQLFLKAVTQFIGVEVTECASCFSDILKAN